MKSEKAGGFNGLVVSLNPAAFGSPETIVGDIGNLAMAIHQLPPATGVERVPLPGERGAQTRHAREREGIPIAAGTVARLKEEAKRLGAVISEAFI